MIFVVIINVAFSVLSLPVLAWQGTCLRGGSGGAGMAASGGGIAPWKNSFDVWAVIVWTSFLCFLMLPFVGNMVAGALVSIFFGTDGTEWLANHSMFIRFALQAFTGCATVGTMLGLLRLMKPDFSFGGDGKDTNLCWHPLFCFLGLQGFALLASLVEWVAVGLGMDKPPGQEIVFELRDYSGDLPVYASAFFAVVVVAPVVEELFFRGLLFPFAKRFLGSWGAMLAIGVLFGAVHMNLVAFLPLALLGAYFCLVYERTGDIRVPIVLHALFNAKTLLLLWLFPEMP